MAVVKNKTNDANREYWSHIEEVAKQVETWPKWMVDRAGQRTCDQKQGAGESKKPHS